MAEDDRTSGLRLTGVGIEFAAAVAGLSLLGYWIDRHFGSSPWGLLIGAGIGLVGGTYNLIRAALAGGRRSGDGRREPPGKPPAGDGE
jgi:ATP synthase protein I